ncbi:MAG: 2-oxoacid:acceptor oxidoreductase family protein [Lentisphaeria bacterium]
MNNENMKSDILQSRGLYNSFDRKGGTARKSTHYCPGCDHGVLHKLIGEAMNDLQIQDRTVALSPVGCAVFAYYYLDCGNVQVAHGRAPAVGTAIQRGCPESIVISYQGDGDLCSIGFLEAIHAANRGENMVIFFVNNSMYGMTGGQMAPTTLVGQKTATSPFGRMIENDGYPLHACEILNELPAPVYIERCSLADSKHISKARQAVRKALTVQKNRQGFAFVEFLSSCPTNMRQTPKEAAEFVSKHMEKEFSLGCLRDRTEEAVAFDIPKRKFDRQALDELFTAQGINSKAVEDDHSFTSCRMKVAGFGGQGVLSLGLLLARAGLEAGRHVTWFPSYGPEQRGGTANCSVVVSGTEIGSPVASQCDLLIAMNQPSFEKFAPTVNEGGTIFYDAGIGDVEIPSTVNGVAVPAFEIASRNGVAKAANTAMAAALAANGCSGLPPGVFESVLEQIFEAKPEIREQNQKVYRATIEWAQRQA